MLPNLDGIEDAVSFRKRKESNEKQGRFKLKQDRHYLSFGKPRYSECKRLTECKAKEVIPQKNHTKVITSTTENTDMPKQDQQKTKKVEARGL